MKSVPSGTTSQPNLRKNGRTPDGGATLGSGATPGIGTGDAEGNDEGDPGAEDNANTSGNVRVPNRSRKWKRSPRREIPRVRSRIESRTPKAGRVMQPDADKNSGVAICGSAVSEAPAASASVGEVGAAALNSHPASVQNNSESTTGAYLGNR